MAVRTSSVRLSGVGRLQPFDELGGVDFEALGDLQDVVEGQVALPSFDLADVGPVQAADHCEGFLGVAEPIALLSNSSAELGGCW